MFDADVIGLRLSPRFAYWEATLGGLRTLASVALPGATRAPRVGPDDAGVPAAPAGEP